MKSSNIFHSPDNGNESTHAPNTYVRSKARVFFVRHGKSMEDSGEIGSIPQSSSAELDDIGKGQIKDVAIYLSNAGIGDRHDILLYGDDTMRVCESVQIITEGVISEINFREKITPRLRTTKKGLQGVRRIKENTAVFTDTVVLMEQIRRWINIHIKGNNAGVILVGHKSNKSGSKQAADNINEAIDISFDIENGGIIERDIDEVTGKYIDPKKHPETLFLNRGNYKEIVESLEDIPELNELIMRFRENTQIESGKYPIWELQNDLNAYFEANKKLYKKYLNSENMDMRVFCLTNLSLSSAPEDILSVKQHLHSFRAIRKTLPLDLLRIFMQGGEDTPLVREAILTGISTTRNEAGKLTISNICTKAGMQDVYLRMDAIATILSSLDSTATDIFEKSLDSLVQDKKLLPRSLYTYRKRSEEEMKKIKEDKKEKQEIVTRVDEYEKIQLSLDSLLSNHSRHPYILTGYVGEGKSTELAWMKDEIDNNPAYIDYATLFYSAKRHNQGNIVEKISMDISAHRESFPDKQVVVFFDGIDELSGDIRESIMKGLIALHSDGVRVILGSRPLGFDKYKNTDIQTLYFNKIDISERGSFLRTRLQSLGASEGVMDKKLQEIEEFLAKPTLSEDLKETPLILFFLMKLCVKNELESIKNRADLYERMTTLLLIEHQKKKGIDYGEHWDSSILLNTLSYCAFQMHSGGHIERADILEHLRLQVRGRLGFDDANEVLESMADQVFLLYQLEGGEYQFILKSFEEYFLARYIGIHRETSKDKNYRGATEGESIIYKMRDINFEKWNNWRNFRPVVLYYGEMLGNSGDIDGLVRLLGEEGLLQNDDMFGEGFFMGLEILYTLPEEVRGNPKLQKILGRYEKIVKKWNLHEVIKRLEPIKKLTKALGNRDTPVTEKITELLRGFSGKKLVEVFGGIVAPRIIGVLQNTVNQYLLEGRYSEVVAIYQALIMSGSQEEIRRAIEFARMMVEKKEFHEAGDIYVALAESGNKEGIHEAIKGAQIMIEKNLFLYTVSIYGSLASSGNEDGIRGAIEFARMKVEKKKFPEAGYIYGILAVSGHEEGISGAIEFARMMVEKNLFLYTVRIYGSLASSGNKDGIRGAIEFARMMIEKKKFHDAERIYRVLAESGHEEGISGAIEFARMMIEKKKFLAAGHIYGVLAESGHEEGISGAMECAKGLMRKEKFGEAGYIYRVLASSGNEDGIQGAIECAKGLMRKEKFGEAGYIYRVLASSGNEDGIRGAIEFARMMIEKKKFHDAERIYRVLAVSGNKDGIRGAIEFARMMIEKKKFHDAEPIYRVLAVSGHEEGISGAMEYARILMKKESFREAGTIYSLYYRQGKGRKDTQAYNKLNRRVVIRKFGIVKGMKQYISKLLSG